MIVKNLSFGSITIDGETWSKGVDLVILSTPEAIKHINDPQTNFIFHLTC
jgi:hypothetical protein